MPFDRLTGALAFLALIPFIIVYLRRPKPTERTLPSLMFFIKDRGTTRFHSFFRQLINSLLFLLQFSILALLAFSIMGYFTEVSAEKIGKTAIVLDVSASMQAQQGSSTRFQAAVDKAQEFLNGRVSIVLAANVPRVVLENGNADDARRILKTVEAIDTSSNIGDALLVARDLLGGKGEVVVLSDFIATEGIDPVVAKRAVSQSAIVTFFDFGGKADNVGITDLRVGKSTTAVSLKNFNDADELVKVQIVNNGVVKDENSITLPAMSLEDFTFETLTGSTEVKLVVDDDFPADNTAYVSVPSSIKTKVLLITNAEKSNIDAALRADPSVSLDVAVPPVVNRFNYDVIILHAFDTKLMLPGYYAEIERAASNGSSVIITGQENLNEAKIKILPVNILGVGSLSRNVVNITNSFTEGIDFGVNEKFLEARTKEGATTIMSAGGSPVLVLSGLGSGMVFYYGLIDDYSSFKSSPAYPQFWSRLTGFLTNTEELGNFNFETGRIEVIQNQLITTPLGKIKTNRVLFDKAGFYDYDRKRVAASLLDERESAVSSDPSVFSEDEKSVNSEQSKLKETRRFYVILALIAAVLIFAELFYIKFRGDL